MDEMRQYYPEPYKAIITSSEIKPRISDGQIMSALKKIDSYKECTKLLPGHIAEVKGEPKVHYRVSTYRTNSKKPWYSISKNKLMQLQNDGIKEICCLFFEKGDANQMNVYYRIWPIFQHDSQHDSIVDYSWNPQEPWSFEEGRSLYRWNPKNGIREMTPTKNGVRAGDICKLTGREL